MDLTQDVGGKKRDRQGEDKGTAKWERQPSVTVCVQRLAPLPFRPQGTMTVTWPKVLTVHVYSVVYFALYYFFLFYSTGYSVIFCNDRYAGAIRNSAIDSFIMHV